MARERGGSVRLTEHDNLPPLDHEDPETGLFSCLIR